MIKKLITLFKLGRKVAKLTRIDKASPRQIMTDKLVMGTFSRTIV